VPTKTQWAGVLANNTLSILGTWSSNWEDHTNYSAARFFGSDLMLPAAGGYISYSGALTRRGNLGCYWGSSEIIGNKAWGLRFLSDSAYTHDYKYRRSGHSIRCVAE
jgi:hypothetical protein